MRRNGRSLTPVIGARITGVSIVTLPIWMGLSRLTRVTLPKNQASPTGLNLAPQPARRRRIVRRARLDPPHPAILESFTLPEGRLGLESVDQAGACIERCGSMQRGR